MKEDIAGLHIGGGYITVAQVKASRNSLSIRRVGWVPYDNNDEDAKLCARLRQAMSNAGAVTCSLAGAVRSSRCLVKPFSYPYMRRDEIAAALQLDAEESLMLPPSEICLDWHTNSSERPSEGEAGGGHVEGVLAATPRQDIESELAVLRQARLYPVRLDAEVIALANFFACVAAEDLRTPGTCLLYLANDRVHVCVFYGESSVYPRTVQVHAKDRHRKAAEVVEDVQEDLRYLMHKLHKPKIEQFALIDGVDGLNELGAQLEEAFAVPVKPWEPLADIDMSKNLRDKIAAGPGTRILPALGLAING